MPARVLLTSPTAGAEPPSEALNTDAEGRLVPAEGLAYAATVAPAGLFSCSDTAGPRGLLRVAQAAGEGLGGSPARRGE
ncbi:hypothetical protein [Frankia sp. Cas3]|uniref:hypothetical protein n=1 Tax=Frankia sp. Cas3 TaxID=3073926 RepID=UPI002AD1E616|nr:hypothetical protein [Frankia sp. Cas3]